MKLSEVFAQIVRDMNESYDNGDLLQWVNRCSDDLTPVANVEASTTFTITSTNQTFTFPTDRHRDWVMKVTDSESEIEFYRPISMRDSQSKGYLAWGSTFTLQHGPETGSITFYYYKKITQMTSAQLDTEMEIDSEFHDLYILYGRGQIQFTEEDMGRGESERVDSMQLYYKRKAEYEKHRAIKAATQETIEVG